MSELSHLELSKCVICQCSTQELLLQMTQKGIAAVIHSCVVREMYEVEVHLKERAGPFLVPGNCCKHFTDLRNVQSACSMTVCLLSVYALVLICLTGNICVSFVSSLQTLRATKVPCNKCKL